MTFKVEDTGNALGGLVRTQGGDFHLYPSQTTYPPSSMTYMYAAHAPKDYVPFVISMYNVEKDEVLYPLTLMVNPNDIQYGHVKSMQNAYTRKGWASTYWGWQQRTITASGSSAGFYYNPNEVVNTAEGLRVRHGGITNYYRRNSLAFANLLALVSYYKRNGAYFLNDIGEQTYWKDGTSRVIHVMDMVMVSYDGTDHIGGFSTFVVNESATMPYRIEYNFEFVVGGIRGDFFDGHLRKADNDANPKVEVSIQGDDMELTKTTRMDEEQLNQYFKVETPSFPAVPDPTVGSPSYTIAGTTTDTSSSTFNVGLDFVYRAEGGYVNNPNDPGGPTNMGITQETYDSYRKSLGLPTQSVTLLTKNEATTIYQNVFWDGYNCSAFPPQIAVIYFDACVNEKPAGVQAVRDLQHALGVTVTGVLSPDLISRVQSSDIDDLASAYIEMRRVFYHKVVKAKPTSEEFLDGWLKRIDNLESYTQNMRA